MFASGRVRLTTHYRERERQMGRGTVSAPCCLEHSIWRTPLNEGRRQSWFRERSQVMVAIVAIVAMMDFIKYCEECIMS